MRGQVQAGPPAEQGVRREADVWSGPARQDADRGPRGDAVAGRGCLGAAAAGDWGLRQVAGEGVEGRQGWACAAPPGGDAPLQAEAGGQAELELHAARLASEGRSFAPCGPDRAERGVVAGPSG